MPTFTSITRPKKRKFEGPHPSALPDPLRLDPVNASPDTPPPPYQRQDPAKKTSSVHSIDAVEFPLAIVEAGSMAKRRRLEQQTHRKPDFARSSQAPAPSASSSKTASRHTLHTSDTTSNSRSTRSSHSLVVVNPDPVALSAKEVSPAAPHVPLKRTLRSSTALSQTKVSNSSTLQGDADCIVSSKAATSTIATRLKKTASAVVKKSVTKLMRSEEDIRWLTSAYDGLLSLLAVPLTLKSMHAYSSEFLVHLKIEVATEVLEIHLRSKIAKVNISPSGAPIPLATGARHLPPYLFLHRSPTLTRGSDASELVKKTLLDKMTGPRWEI